MITRRLVVTGRVQGVGYRYWTVAAARGLGLTGWVRNRLDGAVEILAHGRAADVEALITACHTGPTAARVDQVAVSVADDPGVDRFVQEATV